MKRLLPWAFTFTAAVVVTAQPAGPRACAAAVEDRPATNDTVVAAGAQGASGAAGVAACRGHLLVGVLRVTDRARFPWSAARLHVGCESVPPMVAGQLVEQFPDACGARCFDFAGVVVSYDHAGGIGYQGVGIVVPAFWLQRLAGALLSGVNRNGRNRRGAGKVWGRSARVPWASIGSDQAP